MGEGIAEELEGIDLGDKRLNKRSRKVLDDLYAHPQASINSSCDGWTDTAAAYRLFDNPAVTPEKILAPHREATACRMREHPVVLIVQDTTELDYTSHPPSDAPCLNTADRFGLYAHTHLAVTPEQLCLGVVGCEPFGRTPESLGKKAERETDPIEDKESFRWLMGYRLACELAEECPQTHIVSVADREADIYDLFVEHEPMPSGKRADFIIRSRVVRSLPQRDPEEGMAGYRKVRDEVKSAPLLGTRVIALSQTPKRAARQAVLEIRAQTVTLKPPQKRPWLPPVTLQVVLAEEVGGPDDDTRVSWLLFTSLPTGTLAEALLVIDYYVARWTIEIFFRTLKTGCAAEKIQLETMARLRNCLAFYLIIAARIMYLTYLNRTTPDLSCDVMFSDDEWKSVWVVETKKPLPKKPPSLSEFMKLLTRLGGYNNRATETPPGPQPIWIGVRRMLDFARAWRTFGPEARD
jgi:hypothetical protein